MSRAKSPDEELDSLLWEITVDAKDDDEVMMGFEGFFDEQASFPCSGRVIGQEVELTSIGIAENRPALIATCRRGDHTHEVSLLDVENIDADAATSRLIAAYHRWTGAR